MKTKLTMLVLMAVGVFFAEPSYAADSATNEMLALSTKGEKAFQRKDFNVAIDCYSKVLRLDSNNANAFYARSWAWGWKGKYDEAIKDSTKFIQLSTNNYSLSYAFLSRGSAYFQKTNLELAIDDYSKAVHLNPTLTEAYIARAYAYNTTKWFTSAIVDYTTAILLNPTSAYLFYLRGMAYSENGNLDRALFDFDEAIQLDKTNWMFYCQRGYVLEEKENYSGAIADFDRAIEYNPRDADSFSTRGFLYSKIGEYGEGIEDCKKSILLDKNSANAYNNLAWLLTIAPDVKLRDGKKALKYAKRACELSKWTNAYCLGTLAAAYAEKGNFEEAVKWERKCILIGLPEKEMQQAHKELDLFEQKQPYHAEK